MRRESKAQTYWDQFDVSASILAAQLERQLRMPRARRRGFSGMVGKFEKQRIAFRNGLIVLEREQRKAAMGEAANQANARLLRVLRMRMRVMKTLSLALANILKGKRCPLYVPARAIVDAERVQAETLDKGLTFLHRLLNPSQQSDHAKDIGCFPDIPLKCTTFIGHAHAAFRVALAQKRPRPLRFLDVGCGGGMKALLAAEIFDQADGFDFDPKYVEAGQAAMTVMGATRSRIFEENALSYDGYAEYDVIYFYQPMSDPDGLEALEERIARTARPGTILIAPYLRFVPRAEGLACGRIEEAVYVTGTTQAQADLLRGQAEKIGPQILHPTQAVYAHGVDWIGNLARACAANGYVVAKSS